MSADVAMQRALLKERRAGEETERLKAMCKSQAFLMTRLFAAKLSEQGALLDEALERGGSPDLRARVDGFGAATAWIADEARAVDGASDAELERLREENAVLTDRLAEAENRFVEGGTALTQPEPSRAEERSTYDS